MKLDNTSTAGIKADRWIKKMSMQPTAYVYFGNPKGSSTIPGKEEPLYHEYGSVAFHKEIERIVGKDEYDNKTYTIRNTSPDPAFLPMIEPFEPGQIREQERFPTLKEKEVIETCKALYSTSPEQIYSIMLIMLKKTAPSINRIRIDPVYGVKIIDKKVSWGTTSYGYDIRCGREFKIFTNVNSSIVDPKDFDPKSFVDVTTTDEQPYVIIPPNSFALARTMEFMRIPRNVLTVCVGKSTYARCGIIVNVTPFEPEWEGYVTLEFSNTTPLPAKIYAEEGCAQVLFFESDEDCDVSYKDRGGKYMGQVGLPVVPKM